MQIARLWVLTAGLAALGLAAPASAEPVVAPDRIADVIDEAPDPFPAFDAFAWRAFIALNWPADPSARGEPNRAAAFADPGPRVWETFLARYEALPGPDATPCGSGFAANAKIVSAFEPFAEFNQASFAPGAFDSPLIARNHTYVRYETRLNLTEAGAFGRDGARVPEGGVAVKAAWRLLTDADPPSVRARFYVAHDALVTDVAATRATGRVACGRADLALVGLHIVVRTRSQPQGVWMSFEHVDNTPPAGFAEAREPDARDEGAPYSFNNPRDQQRDVAPPRGWAITEPVSLRNPPRLDPPPMQVIRKHPIQREIMDANRAYWALPGVKGTVFERYMLVSTQWPTVVDPVGPDNDGRYFPGLPPDPDSKAGKYQVSDAGVERNLSNTTMETYQQDQPSSCMACHHAAANARGRDFVGLLP